MPPSDFQELSDSMGPPPENKRSTQALVKLDAISNKGCSPETIQWAMHDLVIRCRKLDSVLAKLADKHPRRLNYLNITCLLNLISLMHLEPPPANQEVTQIDVAIDVETEQQLATREIHFPKA